MKRVDLLAVGGWAVATMGLTLAMFLPGGLVAVDSSAAVKAEIRRPTLTARGCELSARLIDPQAKAPTAALISYKTGDQPVVEMTAVNRTDKPVEVPWSLSMRAAGPVSPMSRMGPVAKEIWCQKGTLMLKAGETQTLTLETKTALPGGNNGWIALQVEKQAIRAVTFAVPQTKQELAAARVQGVLSLDQASNAAVDPVAQASPAVSR